jgi:hypothetical protein
MEWGRRGEVGWFEEPPPMEAGEVVGGEVVAGEVVAGEVVAGEVVAGEVMGGRPVVGPALSARCGSAGLSVSPTVSEPSLGAVARTLELPSCAP